MIMSEILKNIETCRGEDVLAEVSALTQDPHFGSLVNEALDPLKQQALHQAGYDGYSEVIEQHKPYTFASAIIQMKSNLLLLLRALWQYPFGSGTLRSLSDDASLRSLADNASLRSLADMWQHYITRLSGNETYGIPSRLSSLTDLPSAPLLLADRKISGADVEDGMSLVQILMSANHPTELADDNVGWAMTKNLPWSDLTKARLGCSTMNNVRIASFLSLTSLKMDELVTVVYGSSPESYSTNGIIHNLAACTELSFEKLESVSVGSYGSFLSGMPLITKLTFPALKEWKGTWSGGIVANMDGLEELYCPSLILAQGGGAGRENFAIYCPVLWKVVVGYGAFTYDYSTYNFSGCPNLIHLEFEHEVTASQVLRGWNPTNALDASIDTLVTDEDCHNNLEQFLKNFRTYIALRLATFDSNGPTLTLSQAVYDAIKDESHLFVFDEGTMTIYAYLTNIKHWTVTK